MCDCEKNGGDPSVIATLGNEVLGTVAGKNEGQWMDVANDTS